MTLSAFDITGDEFFLYPVDIETLHMLAEMLPPNAVVVNIGACWGASAIAMLEVRPDLFVFSCDVKPWTDDEHEWGNLKKAGLWGLHRCIRVLGRSQDAGLYWPGQVDMVFVDGGHGLEACTNDAVRWKAHIKSGGILAFHDYGHPVCSEVKPAVDKVMAGCEPFMHRDMIVAFEVN